MPRPSRLASLRSISPKQGRQRLYRLNGQALKPIHDWVKEYERLWSDRFDWLDDVLAELESKEEDDDSE